MKGLNHKQFIKLKFGCRGGDNWVAIEFLQILGKIGVKNVTLNGAADQKEDANESVGAGKGPKGGGDGGGSAKDVCSSRCHDALCLNSLAKNLKTSKVLYIFR